MDALAVGTLDPERSDVLSKIRKDFDAAGVVQSDEQILRVMNELPDFDPQAVCAAGGVIAAFIRRSARSPNDPDRPRSISTPAANIAGASSEHPLTGIAPARRLTVMPGPLV